MEIDICTQDSNILDLLLGINTCDYRDHDHYSLFYAFIINLICIIMPRDAFARYREWRPASALRELDCSLVGCVDPRSEVVEWRR